MDDPAAGQPDPATSAAAGLPYEPAPVQPQTTRKLTEHISVDSQASASATAPMPDCCVARRLSISEQVLNLGCLIVAATFTCPCGKTFELKAKYDA